MKVQIISLVGGGIMSINENIKCSVKQCKYNDNGAKYCTLNVIQVGTHEADPKVSECTDCQSFELRQ